MKNKRLLESFSFINDRYVKEAEPKMTNSTASKGKFLTNVACIALVLILGLYLFIPLKPNTVDLGQYANSEYAPLIAAIDGYVYKPKQYKNNFSRIINNISFGFTAKNDAMSAPESTVSSSDSNKYVETTDNQVDGVVEADLLKRTETHIFRLGETALRVYTIDKENSKEIAVFNLPGFADESRSTKRSAEMYLSQDGKTITVIKQYHTVNDYSKVGIISIDVSDPSAPKTAKTVLVDGGYNTSRMVDGNLVLISTFYVAPKSIDYDNPETFVPTISEGNTRRCIPFKDIIYPEKLSSLRYSVVTLMSEGSLELLGASALLCYDSEVYVSRDNVYATREYSYKGSFDGSDDQQYFRTMSDISVLKYSDGSLENKGILTVEGSVKDQYSMDEYNGYFRVVTSTIDRCYLRDMPEGPYAEEILSTKSRSATLTAFNLETFEKVTEIRDFAPEDEEATSVRFDGDKAYVCTAEIITMSDPVYFFDLSDYSNVTYTDTGVIDGFSTSLIQLGEGLLLGIGEENAQYSKVEVYEERDGQVISIDKYTFSGEYDTDYKSYFIDRENNLFGFAIRGMYIDNGSGYNRYNAYVLLGINGYEIFEVVVFDMTGANMEPYSVRAFIEDGYLYITDYSKLQVVKITTG